MGRLVGIAARKAIAWLTGKFLGEVIVSAAVTLLLTAAFSGVSHQSEPAPPTASLPALALTPGIAAMPSLKVSLDNALLTMAPPSFTFDPAPPPPHRTAVAKAVPVRTSTQSPRLRAAPPSDDSIALREPPDTAVVAVAAPMLPPAAQDRRWFTVFGVGPRDLVPSPRRILNGVQSVGHSIVGFAAEL